MQAILHLIRRHPLASFVVLAFGLSWWPTLLEPHSLLPLGPLAAAILVLGVVGGWPAVRQFGRGILAWRIGIRWYVLVLGLPALLAFVGATLNPLFGASAPAFDQAPPLGELLPTFVVIFLLIGIGEEPAWRGFALPQLARKRSMLSAALVLTVIHAIWHLPLFGLEYTWQNVVPWMLTLTAFSVITAWLYTRTAGNLLLPALFHASVNVSAKYLFLRLFSGGDLVQMYWISAALWWLAALVPLAVLRAERARERAPEARTDTTVAATF